MEQAVRKEREVEQARDFIKSRKVGLVAHITIDHPPTNSVSTGILQQIADLVSGYEADDSVRAILLDSANGKPVFAADATDLLANPSFEKQFQLIQAGGRALSVIEFSSKPVVMAIYDGICMGGGLELALACHIRVAGKGTIFSVPEALAGAAPGWGNTQRLVHYFGRAKAIELALTGNQITAAEAHALGAVNHVVAGADVLSKAQEIANGIARMRTKSIRCIMGAMHVPYRIGLAEGKATEHENYMEMYDPKTFVAAVTALFEQRTIEFTD
jgi:enoyl-CoA hydratase/carnithine racemase